MQIVIVGGGKLGSHLARLLRSKGHAIILVEIDSDRCDLLSESMGDVRLVCGDGDEPYVLDEADVRAADAVIAATGHDEDNLVVCLLARLEYRVPLTIARINNPRNQWLFDERFGVNVPVSTAEVIEGIVEKEVSLGDIVTLLRLQADDMAIEELTLPEDARSVGKTIAEVGLPGSTQVMAIISEGKIVVPRGDTVLKAEDQLLILAKSDEEKALQRAFGVHSEPR
ncbi:MAG: NAD-binding protein [Coriobacteriales bacterium]|nr:NAD-binding protein [Coriobacteriales bacterium]